MKIQPEIRSKGGRQTFCSNTTGGQIRRLLRGGEKKVFQCQKSGGVLGRSMSRKSMKWPRRKGDRSKPNALQLFGDQQGGNEGPMPVEKGKKKKTRVKILPDREAEME